MNVSPPEWLSLHGGELRQRAGFSQWIVLLHGEPQYLLGVTPAAGKLACTVTQTNNGRRLDGGGTYASAAEALHAGLDDLRKALGW
jgi:hypothetical protein